MIPASVHALRSFLQGFVRSLLRGSPFIPVLVCLIGTPVLADEPDSRIDKVLKTSGIAAQLEYLPQGILSAVPEDAFPDKKTRADAAAFLKDAWGTQGALAVVQSAVQESLNGEVPEQVINFFDSKVGKKVGKAQQSAIEPSAVKRVREGRSILPSLTEPRTVLLKRIINAQRVAEANGRLLSTVIRGLVDGSLTNGPHVAHPEETARKIALIEKEIMAERQSTDEMVLISYAHLLRPLDDKELEELALYEESEPAARFRDAVQSGLERAVYQYAKALSEYSARPRPPQQKKPRHAPEERPREVDRDSQGPWGD